MSKDLEILKANVKKMMLKDWTETEVTNLDEFMEDVIIATMVTNNLPIHIVEKRSEELNPEKCVVCGDKTYGHALIVCDTCDKDENLW